MQDIDFNMIIFLIATGFIAAFVDSVVGGGGLISTPALLFTGMSPAFALGTGKLASTLGSLTSTLSFLQSGTINKKLVLKLLPLSIIGSTLGVCVVQIIPSSFLKPLILVLLILVTIYTLIKKDWGSTSTFKGMTKKLIYFIISIAFIIGFYDGFLGPGTGSFLIFTFLLMGYSFLESAGNAKVLNFGSNLAAFITFSVFHTVYFTYGIIMGVAMIAGAFVGSKVAIAKGSSYVKVLFVAVTVCLITKSVFDYLR